MYHSRIRFTNNHVTLALDPLTGELIELVDELANDNLLKSHLRQPHQPFSCECLVGDRPVLAWPARYPSVLQDAALKPSIECLRQSDGSQLIRVSYQALMTDDGPVQIGAVYEITLPPDDCRLQWRLSLNNRQAGLTVDKVRFPSVHGIYIGDSWQDDTLVYPYFSGEKIVNPISVLAEEPTRIKWKWQEYDYTYTRSGTNRRVDPDGAFVKESMFSGQLTMLWMDLSDDDHGLYLGCADPRCLVATLRAETYGPTQPGLGLAIVHHPFLGQGSWQSPDCVLALHPGDWHWGADCYRSDRLAAVSLQARPRPDWFERSPGLVAHYDFKYQNGGIVHRFADIPDLFRQAQAMGFRDLLLAGWHQDGFDNGFPEYRPDPDLGSEQELIDALAWVRGQGGQVMFYVNSRLSNTRYEHRRRQRQDSCAMRRDGSFYTEKYGDRDIEFAAGCAGSATWQQEIAGAVDYLVNRVGASGVYLDQVATASPIFCFHPDHQHDHLGWNQGYQQMLREIFKRCQPGQLAILYEGASDNYGAGVAGQLISTIFYHHIGAFPELYKYTWPDQILVDMLYPKRGLAMRPVHIAQISRAVIDRAFLVGSYYWVYDLAEDNSFLNDPEQYVYLQQVVALRQLWLDRFGHGTFRDTEGIVQVSPGLTVKRYQLGPQEMLLAVANPTGDAGASVDLPLPTAVDAAANDGLGEAWSHDLDQPADGRPVSILPAGAGSRRLAVSPAPLSLVLVRD